MKTLPFLLLLSSIALADVGPRPPKCNVPQSCTTCGESLADEAMGADCRTAALDAGLILSECSDRVGSGVTRYYCPKGTTVSRGCSSVDVLGLSALGLLLLRRRSAK